MLVHLRPQARRSLLASCPTQCGARRGLSASRVCLRERRQPEMTFEQFTSKIGKQFENADKPRKWLGSEVPFPMNPSFQPPIPISDSVRTTMYRQYMTDPIKNNVRELARQYHLSIKRVDSILRLKGQEESWIKNRQLQTGFRAGMEMLLGVRDNERSKGILRDADADADLSRLDVDEADAFDQEEGRRRARQRYQHMYWESIPESESEPVMPTILEKLKGHKAKQSDDSVVKPHPKPSLKHQTLTVSRPGRPTMQFIDVGDRFLDVKEHHRRNAAAARRAQVRARKREGSKVGS